MRGQLFASKELTQKEKDEAAINSFNESFLNNDEKKLINSWIRLKKIIKFNLLFSINKDGVSISTFHYYDGIFPTVMVVLDTNGSRFLAFSTQNLSKSNVGGLIVRNLIPLFLAYQICKNMIYLTNLITMLFIGIIPMGQLFGEGYDLYLADSCASNTSSSYIKSSYNTGNNDLLGGSGTNFQVSYYELYQVIFE